MIEYHEEPEVEEPFDDPEPGCSSWNRSTTPPWMSSKPMTARQRLDMKTPFDDSDSEDHEEVFQRRSKANSELEKYSFDP